MSLFQKKLEDVVRGARAPGVDPGVWNPHIMKELKEELKSKEPEVKAIALTKLFYFLQEGSNIDWASFNILDCMSSTNTNAKKIGLMFASLIIYSNPDAMTMSTNYFKKEIKSNEIRDVSLVLSCLGNICNKELGQELLASVLNATSHTKPLIRKKALATLRTIFEGNPSVIQSCMEKIASRLQEEQEPNALATCISICNTVIALQPQLHPVLIKPLFALFEGRKSNWVQIKLVKLFDKMITLEPRLKKKLTDVYLKMFSQNQAKSLEYELIMTVLNHFSDATDLYQKACLCLKTFIESQDQNLKVMGLESLKQLLQNDPKIFSEYYDFLITCYKKGDHLNKITIAGIFADFIDDRSVEETVNLMIADIPNMAMKESAFDAVDAVIKNILKLCSKNYYANVSDPEWFLMEVLLKIFPRMKNSDTAKLAVEILLDFSLRAEEIRDIAIEFGTKMLQSLDQGELSFRSVGQSPFLFTYENEDAKSSSVALRVIEALLFIFGDYSSHLKDLNGFFSIIKSLEKVDSKILIDVSGPLEISLSKLIIIFTEFIMNNKDQQILKDAAGELEIDESEANSGNIIHGYFSRCLRLYSKTLAHGQGHLTFYSNYYIAAILSAIDPDNSMSSAEQINLSETHINNILALKEKIFQKIKPIQKNAQKLVKISEEIQNLTIDLTQEEQEMLKYFDKDISKIVQAVSKPDEEKKSNASSTNIEKTTSKEDPASNDGGDGEEISPKTEQKPAKQKKEFKIRVEEDAPNQDKNNV